MLRVIILGGHVQALGIVRALAGYYSECEIWDKTIFSVARKSKYIHRFKYFKSFSENLIVPELLNKSSEEGKTFIFPTDDITVRILSENFDLLTNKGLYPVVDRWPIVSQFYFKNHTYALAKKLGIPYPKSFIVNYDMNIPDDILFPMILKPTVMQAFYKLHRKKVVVCKDKDELLKNMQLFTDERKNYQLLVQEIIPGSAKNLYSFGMVRVDNKILGGITARRKRQYPSDFGDGSTFVETCEIEILKEYSIRIIEEVGYNGICEVEFKFDERDHKFKLLEVNPRLWRWHSIGTLVDLNFPKLFIEAKLSKSITPLYIDSLVSHVAWRDLFPDIVSIFLEAKKRDLSLKELFDEFRIKKIDSVWSRFDPMPFFYLIWILPFLAKGSRSGI